MAGEHRAEQVLDIERELLAMYADPALDHKPALLEQRGGAYYSEAAAALVTSLLTGDGAHHYVDVRNGGTIAGLPDEAVVEVPALRRPRRAASGAGRAAGPRDARPGPGGDRVRGADHPGGADRRPRPRAAGPAGQPAGPPVGPGREPCSTPCWRPTRPTCRSFARERPWLTARGAPARRRRRQLQDRPRPRDDRSGDVLARVRGAGTQSHSGRGAGMIAGLADLVAEARVEAGLGERRADRGRRVLHRQPRRAGGRGGGAAGAHAPGAGRRTEVRNDTLAALRAGAPEGWGVAVVSGAGINAVGMHPDGREERFLALGDVTGDWGGGSRRAGRARGRGPGRRRSRSRDVAAGAGGRPLRLRHTRGAGLGPGR